MRNKHNLSTIAMHARRDSAEVAGGQRVRSAARGDYGEGGILTPALGCERGFSHRRSAEAAQPSSGQGELSFTRRTLNLRVGEGLGDPSGLAWGRCSSTDKPVTRL